MSTKLQSEHAPKYKAQSASGATATSGLGGTHNPVVGLADLAGSLAVQAIPGTWLVGRPLAMESEIFRHPVSGQDVEARALVVETTDPLAGTPKVRIALATGADVPAVTLGATYAFPVYQAIDPTTGAMFRRLLPGHCIVALDAPSRQTPTLQAAGPLIDPAPALEPPRTRGA